MLTTNNTTKYPRRSQLETNLVLWTGFFFKFIYLSKQIIYINKALHKGSVHYIPFVLMYKASIQKAISTKENFHTILCNIRRACRPQDRDAFGLFYTGRISLERLSSFSRSAGAQEAPIFLSHWKRIASLLRPKFLNAFVHQIFGSIGSLLPYIRDSFVTVGLSSHIVVEFVRKTIIFFFTHFVIMVSTPKSELQRPYSVKL